MCLFPGVERSNSTTKILERCEDHPPFPKGRPVIGPPGAAFFMKTKPDILPDKQNLLDQLTYDPISGMLIWNDSGKLAGAINDEGYLVISFEGYPYLAHRIIWVMLHDEWPPEVIDHINGNPSDNREANLRVASLSQNQHNRKLNRDNKSGVKGVYWCSRRQKFHGQIKINGRRKSVGMFATIEKASAAMREARIRLHGDFSRHS